MGIISAAAIVSCGPKPPAKLEDDPNYHVQIINVQDGGLTCKFGVGPYEYSAGRKLTFMYCEGVK